MKPVLFPALRPIAERAGLIRMFDLLLQEALPHALIGRIRALNLRNGILVLGADHASLATQARFQSNHWLTQLNVGAARQPGLPQLTGIEIRVTAEAPARKTRRIGQSPDPESRQALLHMAEAESDPLLASALRRLAQVRRKDSAAKTAEEE